jgi:hypothetical protein
MASFNVNIATPPDILGSPVLVVGTVGGTSCAFVRVASRIVSAEARAADANTTTAVSTAVHNRRIYNSFLGIEETPAHTLPHARTSFPSDRTVEAVQEAILAPRTPAEPVNGSDDRFPKET